MELLEDRQDLEPDAVAGVLAGQVREIRAVRLPGALQIIEDLLAGPLDEGSHEPPSNRRDARETA